MTTTRRRGLVILAAGLVPWVVVPYETGLSLLFSAGLLTPGPLYFQSVVGYVRAAGTLPPPLLAYPVASLLYALGVGSFILDSLGNGQGDRRVTAGLFVLAGLDVLYFAVAFSSTRLRIVALPFGTALLWLAAWATRPRSWRSIPSPL